MKRRARLLRYCDVVQFMAAVYIKNLRKNPSQFFGAYRHGLRLHVRREHLRFRSQSRESGVWINSYCAFVMQMGCNGLNRLVLKKRGDKQSKVTVLHAKIHPILCSEPVAFVDELCAFNLANKGVNLEDAFIEIFNPAGTSGGEEACNTPCVISKAHIALIITSFYDEEVDCSDELREYFQIPRLVSVGDIVAIPQREPWNGKVVDIFFKISGFGETEAFSEAIIDSRETALYQDEAIYSKIPYSDVKCYVPEKFTLLAQQIATLIRANATMKSFSPLFILLSGLPGSGKKLFLKHLSSLTHLDVYFQNCFVSWSDSPDCFRGRNYATIKKVSKNPAAMLAYLYADLFSCPSTVPQAGTQILTSLVKDLKASAIQAVFFVYNNERLSCLPAIIRSLILYHFEIPVLTEEDRQSVIMHELREANLVDVAAVSRLASGFTLSELHILLADAEFRKHETNSPQLTTDHFAWAVDVRNRILADKVGAPIIPKVTWDDIGGLEDVKQIVIESLILNLKGKGNMKRSGLLLYGPPGCGKTLIAKADWGGNLSRIQSLLNVLASIAVANQFKITFLSVKGPELFDKYVGQSEANVRKVFNRARMAAPCVVFFDELDSLASNRGRCDDGTRVADNVVSQLTAELDNLESSKIFILGATNRPDLLDSALLRPGRFDKIIEVGGTRDVLSRERILRAASRNVLLADDVNLEQIAHLCGHLSSGADLHAVISRAQMDAISERILAIEAGLATPEEECVVTQNNLRNAVKKVTSSIGTNCGQLRGL